MWQFVAPRNELEIRDAARAVRHRVSSQGPWFRAQGVVLASMRRDGRRLATAAFRADAQGWRPVLIKGFANVEPSNAVQAAAADFVDWLGQFEPPGSAPPVADPDAAAKDNVISDVEVAQDASAGPRGPDVDTEGELDEPTPEGAISG